MNFSKLKYSAQRSIINIACYLIDSLFHPFIKPKYSVETKQNILLIRPDAIGDFIVWLASAKVYRTIYPASKFNIYLLGNALCEEMALKTGFFDTFIPFDRKKFMLNWVYRYTNFQLLNSIQFDTVIYSSYSREFSTGDLLMKNINAKNKIGTSSDNAVDSYFWLNLGNKWYTHLLEITFNGEHEILKNASFVGALSGENTNYSLPDLSSSNDNLSFFIRDFAANVVGNKPYFVLFPGARVGIRLWPSNNYIKLAQNIIEKTGWIGVLLGSKAEHDLCETISKNSPQKIINFAGKTSLVELIQIIGNAKMFIGNETSGIHIAIAQKTPSLCILGGGHFGRFMPYPISILKENQVISNYVFHHMPCFNCDWNCIYQTSKSKVAPCISNISVENAIAKTDEILNKISKREKLD